MKTTVSSQQQLMEEFNLTDPSSVFVTEDARFAVLYPDGNWSAFEGMWHGEYVSHLMYRWGTPMQQTVRQCNDMHEAQEWAMILNALGDRAKLHTPTSSPCRVIRVEGDRSFCDFFGKTDPFTWVNNNELR